MTNRNVMKKNFAFLHSRFSRLFRRKYDYSRIDCYYAKGERLLLSPEGECLPFGGGIQIEPIFEIRAPFERQELERKIDECFSLCWSKTVDEYPKGPSIIEKHLGIRGYKKIVRQFDFFCITYNKVSKSYSLMKLSKAANYKSYSGVEATAEMGEKIDYDYILRMIQEED